MIFVTVGTDLPFDRMVKVIDRWARENGRKDVFAQIGEGAWEPEYISFSHFLQPPEFMEKFKSASVIISHAGMGTILSALHHGKPILVVPKRASLGEHRNEHQTATANHMSARGLVSVAADEDELLTMLDGLEELSASPRIGPHAGPELIENLRNFIHLSGHRG